MHLPQVRGRQTVVQALGRRAFSHLADLRLAVSPGVGVG